MDFSRQSWPRRSHAAGRSLSRLYVTEKAHLSQLPPATSPEAVVFSAYSLLLSAYCGTQAIGFSLQILPTTDSANATVTVDVNTSLSVAAFIATQSKHFMEESGVIGHQPTIQDETASCPSTRLALRRTVDESIPHEGMERVPVPGVLLSVECAITGHSVSTTASYDPESL